MPNYNELIPGLRVENINAMDKIDNLNRSNIGITRADWISILAMPGVSYTGEVDQLPNRVELDYAY